MVLLKLNTTELINNRSKKCRLRIIPDRCFNSFYPSKSSVFFFLMTFFTKRVATTPAPKALRIVSFISFNFINGVTIEMK